MPLGIFASKSVSCRISKSDLLNLANSTQLQGKKNNLTETNLFTHSPILLFTLKRVAFTLTEVLITLGIIGVVAALTLPTVIQNYQKKVTITKLQKAYSILGQVAQKSIADNGAIDFTEGEKLDATAVEKFFDTYWLSYFNEGKVLRSSVYLNNAYRLLNGEFDGTGIYTNFSHGRVLFSTADGTIYLVFIMKWDFKYDDEGNLISQDPVFDSRQRVHVDLNGLPPPNTLGKDVFMFEIDFDKGAVKPYGYYCSTATINSNCSNKNSGVYCAAKIMKDGWKISDDYPW